MSPLSALLFASALVLTSCDKEPTATEGPPETAVASAPPRAVAPEPETQAPEIIVDHLTAAVGKERLPVEQPELQDRVAALLAGQPAVEGRTVSFVAMRNAKPSQVAAVANALRQSGALGAMVRSEARDGTTEPIPLSFAPAVADCTTVAWIAKDATIAVWPAGGGVAKRVVRGLAGPDMTLGLAAVRERQERCGSSEWVVGGDDSLPWGVVFDLAESVASVPGARAAAAILVTRAAPGRRVTLR